jgi:predicted AlkP superfamily pyrophosphatase or phosphodiesterase
VIAASYQASGDGAWETNPACYRLPEYLKTMNARQMWEKAGGRWMDHDIASASRFRASSLFQRLEGEALLAVVEHEALGTDAITDLVLINMKGPDYSGHAWGPDSAELKETLAELDRQVTRVWKALEQKAGAGQSVMVATADHGMPAEPPPGRRIYGDDVVAMVHQRFDPSGALVKLYANDTANSQLYIDMTRLQSLGVSLKEVAAFLEAQDFIAAAFTEDDVRAASRLLRP